MTCAGVPVWGAERVPVGDSGGVHGVDHEAQLGLAVLAEHAALQLWRGLQCARPHSRGLATG